MTRIVATHCRYKRPPRKKPKAAAIEAPAIVRTGEAPSNLRAPSTNDDRKPATLAEASSAHTAKSAIVTARRPKTGANIPPRLLPDTEEELQRRADAADALWRELVRRVAEKVREEKD